MISVTKAYLADAKKAISNGGMASLAINGLADRQWSSLNYTGTFRVTDSSVRGCERVYKTALAKAVAKDDPIFQAVSAICQHGLLLARAASRTKLLSHIGGKYTDEYLAQPKIVLSLDDETISFINDLAANAQDDSRYFVDQVMEYAAPDAFSVEEMGEEFFNLGTYSVNEDGSVRQARSNALVIASPNVGSGLDASRITKIAALAGGVSSDTTKIKDAGRSLMMMSASRNDPTSSSPFVTSFDPERAVIRCLFNQWTADAQGMTLGDFVSKHKATFVAESKVGKNDDAVMGSLRASGDIAHFVERAFLSGCIPAIGQFVKQTSNWSIEAYNNILGNDASKKYVGYSVHSNFANLKKGMKEAIAATEVAETIDPEEVERKAFLSLFKHMNEAFVKKGDVNFGLLGQLLTVRHSFSSKLKKFTNDLAPLVSTFERAGWDNVEPHQLTGMIVMVNSPSTLFRSASEKSLFGWINEMDDARRLLFTGLIGQMLGAGSSMSTLGAHTVTEWKKAFGNFEDADNLLGVDPAVVSALIGAEPVGSSRVLPDAVRPVVYLAQNVF